MSRHFGYKKYPVNMIACACGCGQLIEDRDKKCRPRRFIRGHAFRSLEARHVLSSRLKGKKKWPNGRKFGAEAREHMRLGHLGKKLPVSTRINMSKSNPKYMLGKHLSEVTRQKIREKRKFQIFTDETRAKLSGENSGRWRGGLSIVPYTKDFNKALKIRIRDRDGHLCQLCGKTELENIRALTVHHVNYDKSNCRDNNLISLCSVCNTKVNSDREFWIEYFSQLLRYVAIVSDQPSSMLVAI